MDGPTTTTRLGSTGTGGTTGDPGDLSLGELVAAATRDLSLLMRQEVELAKTELKSEVKTAGLGAGMFGGAGLTGFLAVIFLSISLAYGLAGLGLPLGWGFFLVGALYLLAAGALALAGKKKIAEVDAPEKTIETLKDDVEWAKHPTRP
jgi:hypothetical protein